jgi:hypothetical protein
MEEMHSTVQARGRARATLLLILVGATVLFVSAGFFAYGTIVTGRERDQRQNAIVKKVIVAQVIAKKAVEAESRDHAIIFAVCQAFNRRDRAEAYYDAVVLGVARKYASTTNEYAEHVRPVFLERARVMQVLASSDCQHLMERAEADSKLPISKRPTPTPIMSGLPF